MEWVPSNQGGTPFLTMEEKQVKKSKKTKNKKKTVDKAYRFMLIANGRHVEDGVRYKKGQVVKSNRRLDLIFKNKFELIGEPEEVTAIENTADTIPVPPVVEDDKGKDDDDVDDNDEDDDDQGEEPVVTFEVKKHAKGKYDVVKCIDGEVVQEMNEDEYITTKKAAAKMARKLQKEWDKKMAQAAG